MQCNEDVRKRTKAANLEQISSSKLNILTISMGFGVFPTYVLQTEPLPVKKHNWALYNIEKHTTL